MHGETALKRPLLAVKDPVAISDLHATILAAMGLSPATEFNIEGRPFYVTEDGKGRPGNEVFA